MSERHLEAERDMAAAEVEALLQRRRAVADDLAALRARLAGETELARDAEAGAERATAAFDDMAALVATMEARVDAVRREAREWADRAEEARRASAREQSAVHALLARLRAVAAALDDVALARWCRRAAGEP